MARVLIVDDEQSIRTSIGAFVENEGHEVSLAADAAEALELLAEKPFDVVVTDIILPRKTGVALLTDIREEHPDVQVIMITGEPEVGTAAEAVRKGAFDYLSKPVSRGDISRVLAAAATKKVLLDKNRQLENENRKYREGLEVLVEERTGQLRDSEARYRSLFTSIDEPIFVFDRETSHFLDCNQSALDRYGYTIEELRTMTPQDLHSTKEKQRVSANIANEGAASANQYTHSTKDGEEIPVEIHTTTLEYQGKQTWISIVHDITERKHAEAKEKEHYKNVAFLSETAIRFVDFPVDEDIYRYIGNRIRELAGEAIVVVNSISKAGEVMTNRVMLGLGRIATQVASLIGRNPEGMTFVPQRDELLYLSDRKLHDSNKSLYVIMQKAVPKPICVALEQLYGITKIYTIGFARENTLFGTAVIFLSKGHVLETSEFIEAFANQASIALQRKQVEESLQASEVRFRTFFENQPALCYMISPETTILDVNETTLRVLGYQKSELVGKPVSMIYSAKSVQRQRELAAQWKKTGQIRNEEMTIVSKSGQERAVLLSTDSVRDAEGHIVHSISVQLDITKRKEAEKRQQRLLDGIIESVSMITQVRDPYTAGHQRRVTELACAVAEKLGLDQEQTAGLQVAGLLHDIGKLSVPAEILSKPTALTDIEFSLIKTHVQVAYDILRGIEFPWPVADIVLQHHERVDGSGYPNGLRGDEILLEARILAVSDVVEAMSGHRPYRPALGIAAALEEISGGSVTRYDEKVVKACCAVFEDGFEFQEI